MSTAAASGSRCVCSIPPPPFPAPAFRPCPRTRPPLRSSPTFSSPRPSPPTSSPAGEARRSGRAQGGSERAPQQWLERQPPLGQLPGSSRDSGAKLEIPEGGFRVPVEDDEASSQHKGAPRTPQVTGAGCASAGREAGWVAGRARARAHTYTHTQHTHTG